MAYTRNPRKRIIRGSSSDELRRGGRRTSEEFVVEGDDFPFVRLGSSAIGTQQDVVQRIGNAIIGGDFGGNARGEGALDIQVTRFSGYDEFDVGIVDASYVASGSSSIAIGRDSRAAGAQAVAMGYANIADSTYSVAVGAGNEVTVGLAVAVGAFNSVSVANEGVALGYANIVTGFRGVAVGRTARVDYDYGVAVGNNATARERAVALGATAGAHGLSSVSIGESSFTDSVAARAIAIGKNAEALVSDQAVIAATTIKMQVSYLPTVVESVITTSVAAPVTGNVATWADVDRIGDGGIVVGDVALKSLTLAQFASTTSAQLAGVLSDETGSGALVFATSPTLVTPNLGTPSAVVLTNATGLPTAGLLDDSVTYAKMQNISATDKLLGRATAGAGDVEEIALTAAARTVLDDTTVAAMATTLGLGTGDSPQFTAVNVGHASDTTLTRVSAGKIAVEGATVALLSAAQTFTANQTLKHASGTTALNIDGVAGQNRYIAVMTAGSARYYLQTVNDTEPGSDVGSDLELLARNDSGGGIGRVFFVKRATAHIGFGTNVDNGQVSIDQASTTAAVPPLYLNQADVSEEMIELNTTIGTGNAIEAVGAKTLTTTHFVKMKIPGGLTVYFPVGTIA